MQTFFLFALIIASVGLMVIAISKWKIHPFIVMTVIALLVGLIWGAVYPESELTPAKVVNSVKSGFGDIMTSIGIVILCGTIIGTILEKTGAALTMANAILKLVGKKRSVVAMGAMGYVTGIPVFCDSGFVVLSPISRALAAQSNVSLAVMGTALSGGLYATHCLVPPTPGPIAMAGTLNADLGLTILVGLVISIPAVVVAVLYAKLVASKIDIHANSEYTLDELKEDAIACTDASKNQYGIGIPYDYASYCEYLWANGGDVISTDGKENLLNSQENIDTLTWLQDLAINEGVSPEGLTAADADTMFQAGQLAMYTSGPWNINGLNQLGVNYGITAIPAGSAGAFSPEGGCSYMLTKGADDATRAAVYKFMAYWLSDATLKEWSNRNGFPVWSYSVLEDEDIKANEILSNVSKASEIGRDWHLNLTIGSQIDSDVMQPMMEKILAGEDVAENVKAASDILDGIIAAQ